MLFSTVVRELFIEFIKKDFLHNQEAFLFTKSQLFETKAAGRSGIFFSKFYTKRI